MVREEAERRAVEDDRAPERILRLVQLADDLIEAHHRVPVAQHRREIDADRLELLAQRPRVAARLVEVVVDLGPWRLDDARARRRRRLLRIRIAGEIGVDALLADARRKPL